MDSLFTEVTFHMSPKDHNVSVPERALSASDLDPFVAVKAGQSVWERGLGVQRKRKDTLQGAPGTAMGARRISQVWCEDLENFKEESDRTWLTRKPALLKTYLGRSGGSVSTLHVGFMLGD